MPPSWAVWMRAVGFAQLCGTPGQIGLITARLGRMGGRKEAAFCRKRGQCTSLMTCASVCCSAWTLTLPYSVAPLLRESSRASTRGNFFVCPQVWDRIGLKVGTLAIILADFKSSSTDILYLPMFG